MFIRDNIVPIPGGNDIHSGLIGVNIFLFLYFEYISKSQNAYKNRNIKSIKDIPENGLINVWYLTIATTIKTKYSEYNMK